MQGASRLRQVDLADKERIAVTLNTIRGYATEVLMTGSQRTSKFTERAMKHIS